MAISENIRRLREERGIKQKELAERISVTPALVARFEAGTKVPSVALALAIAEVFECSTDEIIKGN